MRKNQLIYLSMAGCCMCETCRQKLKEECERLGIEFIERDGESKETTEIGEIRSMPYAIVTYNGKVIKGGGWAVWDILKEL